MSHMIDLDECLAIKALLKDPPLRWRQGKKEFGQWYCVAPMCGCPLPRNNYKAVTRLGGKSGYTKGHSPDCKWLLARREAGMT